MQFERELCSRRQCVVASYGTDDGGSLYFVTEFPVVRSSPGEIAW